MDNNKNIIICNIYNLDVLVVIALFFGLMIIRSLVMLMVDITFWPLLTYLEKDPDNDPDDKKKLDKKEE